MIGRKRFGQSQIQIRSRTTWFNLVTFEGEAARFNGNTRDTGMTAFTASALLSPPIGGFTPYGGIGYGLYRQSTASDSHIGRLRHRPRR